MDWEITPNRPDWLSHVGIAREIAAVADRRHAFQLPDVALAARSGAHAEQAATVDVRAPDLCPRYVARIIGNVTVGPSPAWMCNALEAVGIRPINNVVDITNYVLMECGQPLHAFDYDLVADHTIVVRRATPNESMTTLDGTVHELTRDNLVIADTKKAVALAGVMGGQNSEISEFTTTVLLESAVFHPPNIRATARAMGVSTESSYRFERGVDPQMTEYASRRAAALLAELAGGEVLEGSIDVWQAPYKPHRVTCRLQRINSLLGVQLDTAAVAGFFERLGLEIVQSAADEVTVAVPSFRLDLTREADLIEEVARLYGLQNIPALPAAGHVGGSIRDDAQAPREEVRNELLGLGLSEAINDTLLGQDDAVNATGMDTADLLALANPISAENACLRPSLLPGLVRTVSHNIAHHNTDLALFEIGRVMAAAGDTEEHDQAGIVLTGHPNPERFGTDRERTYDFFDLKGLLEGWFRARRVENIACVAASHPAFKPGATAEFRCEDRFLAVAGEVNPELTTDIRLTDPLFVALVDLDALLAVPTKPRVFQPLPQFPATVRDISLEAPVTLTHREIRDAIRAANCPWLETIQLFDVYEDPETLGEGKRSLAYSLTYRHDERTLTDEEANDAHDKVKAKLAEQLPVEFR